MIITKKSLNYIFEITKYLYFNLEIDQEIEVKKLSKEASREMFAAALDFIIDRNLTHLGGFQIRYTDESRQAIKKVPHLFVKGVEGFNDNKHVLPFEFKRTTDNKPLVVAEKYVKLFEYGNT